MIITRRRISGTTATAVQAGSGSCATGSTLTMVTMTLVLSLQFGVARSALPTVTVTSAPMLAAAPQAAPVALAPPVEGASPQRSMLAAPDSDSESVTVIPLQSGGDHWQGNHYTKRKACAGNRSDSQCIAHWQYGVLSRSVHTEHMQKAYLDFYGRLWWHQSQSNSAGCRGAPCPAFSACAPLHPTFSACRFDDLQDKQVVELPAVMEFTPSIELEEGKAAEQNGGGGEPEKHWDNARSSSVDVVRNFFRPEPFRTFLFQVYLLRDVFISSWGEVFNATHRVNRNGCAHRLEMTYPKGQVAGIFAPAVPVLNWSNKHHTNFFHFLAEALPSLVVGLRALQGFSNLHTFASSGQWKRYKVMGKPLLGLSSSNLNAISAPPDSLHFGYTVYQPVLQPCSHNSRSFWRWFRHNHLLHPNGLPIFNPNRTLRTPLSSPSDSSIFKLPKDWVVVLGRRRGCRELDNVTAIRSLLVELFGAARVVEYFSSSSILTARNMFRRARLFVAAHGAGLTNIVFMPPNSTILEIRPRHFPNSCYRTLAFACDIRYHLSVGDGDKATKLSPQLEDLRKNLDYIRNRFAVEDKDG